MSEFEFISNVFLDNTIVRHCRCEIARSERPVKISNISEWKAMSQFEAKFRITIEDLYF